MKKEEKQVMNLLKLCLKINNGTKHDVFFEYSTHVKLVSIRIYLDGWVEDHNCNYSFYIYLDEKHGISFEEIHRTLNNILNGRIPNEMEEKENEECV